jgi:lysophospholipase L1-like esterase
MKRLVVVGDSDIAYWPKELLPSASSCDDAGKGGIVAKTTEWDQPPLVSGHSGATLAGVLPHLRMVLAESSMADSSCGGEHKGTSRRLPSDETTNTNTLIVVACAGENDIGEGLSLGHSVEALREFADTIFHEHNDQCGDNDNVFLIFLGPKFEPWLEHDPSEKKKYTAMARAFRRCLEEYQYDDSTNTSTNISENKKDGRIHFIDCLTIFCGETANVPGARLGGRAKADPRFFASDQLHLSKEGYAIWKEVVETRIRLCLASSR